MERKFFPDSSCNGFCTLTSHAGGRLSTGMTFCVLLKKIVGISTTAIVAIKLLKLVDIEGKFREKYEMKFFGVTFSNSPAALNRKTWCNQDAGHTQPCASTHSHTHWLLNVSLILSPHWSVLLQWNGECIATQAASMGH